MMCRWVKLAIHRELDVARDSEAARRGGLAMDLEVEGAILDTSAGLMSLEAEQEATALLAGLQSLKKAAVAGRTCEEAFDTAEHDAEAEWHDCLEEEWGEEVLAEENQ